MGPKRRPLAERFWEKVEKGDGDGCWLWTASTDGWGYGKIGRGGTGGGMTKAHRLSWELANGPIPDGLCILHRCDTPSCVRPDHLFLGTHVENMADRAAKGRSARGSRHGRAKLTAYDVADIRRRIASGEVQREIATFYGVSKTTITNIKQSLTWAHFTSPLTIIEERPHHACTAHRRPASADRPASRHHHTHRGRTNRVADALAPRP